MDTRTKENMKGFVAGVALMSILALVWLAFTPNPAKLLLQIEIFERGPKASERAVETFYYRKSKDQLMMEGLNYNVRATEYEYR